MLEARSTHYQRLGVSFDADPTDVRAAYLRVARLLHPDLNQGLVGPAEQLAQRRMREINESFEVLRDPSKRAAYDERLRLGGA